MTESTSSSTTTSTIGVFAMLDRFVNLFAIRFGDRAIEVERFLKFAIVGAIGAIVDFSTLNLLEMTIFPPVGSNEGLNVATATSIAFTLAVINNYILNRYWTFPDSRSRPVSVQLTQFFVVSLVGLVFRLILVSATYASLGELAHNMTGAGSSAESINQIGSNIAQAISIFIVLFWNFFANRYWTYSDVDQEG